MSELERYIIDAQRDYDARMADAKRAWKKEGECETLLRLLEHFSQKRFGKSIDELSEVLQQKSNDELQNLLDVICFAPSYEDFLAQL